jgi:molybdopterin converting factor small subunit
LSVTVLYFASLRDAAGVESEVMPRPDSLPGL